MGAGGPFTGAKEWPGSDAEHSPPPSAEVENEDYISFPLKTLHGV
jgi:hypothetical protein